MYRCGWASRVGQERVLALRLRRAFFDSWLREAVPSSFAAARHLFATPDTPYTPDSWARAVATSEVRLQWDPDHTPSGAKSPRRAVQLGLRGSALRALAEDALLQVIDMTDFVIRQRAFAPGRLALPAHTCGARLPASRICRRHGHRSSAPAPPTSAETPILTLLAGGVGRLHFAAASSERPRKGLNR